MTSKPLLHNDLVSCNKTHTASSSKLLDGDYRRACGRLYQSQVGISGVEVFTKSGSSDNSRGFLSQSKLGRERFNELTFPMSSSFVRRERSNLTCLYAAHLGQRRTFAFEQSSNTISDKETNEKETITVTFVDKDGDEKIIKVPIGMSMLEAAHKNDVELEGACEGSLACSTCHVIVMDDDYYEKLPEPIDEENDMLDLAFGLTETSRLGCQVIAKPELDGIRLALPAATRNFAVDGHVPKPH
ncbi:hypothetical protein O6H91_09G108100 [Diphasiastrum complanatum]|uniref:Uncharacterized protein n=1 Tax=Diphasiastrum complanatum TaxID=34168 RepID=A0ACC2CSV5_DIPCM|nr:hypothetical protein O6H91_09G108100 [Diphasiastrum complanatum]